MTYRQANWIINRDEKIFFWHHMPQKESKNIAIVIIGPIGPEYMPCHRSIRLLADDLSKIGFHTLRYDPVGMGNSSGSLANKNIWHQWVRTPEYFTDYLKNNFNINEVIFIGLRSGCLVLSEAIKKSTTKTVIFWHPITRGKTFIRGIQLLDSVLYKNEITSDSKQLEGGGYPFSEELQNEIKNINLLSQDFNNIKSALIINDEDSTVESKLNTQLILSDAKTDSVYVKGLSDMIKQVTLSKIPYENINIITSWLKNLDNTQQAAPINIQNTKSKYTTANYSETLIEINAQRNIFGLLTSPNDNNKDKIVVFVNTGAAHHAGPNRIHVDTARILATQGISTLRIDLSNLGDSTESYEKDPPEEYPQTAAEDINNAINYIDENIPYKEIILCGISAGAHNIFHAALVASSKNLCKIILINPETFYWNPSQTIFSSENTKTDVDQVYYQKQMYNYKKWLKLISNPIKIYNTSLFLFSLIFRKSKSILLQILNLLGIKAKSRLEKDITYLGTKDIIIALIHSKDDPGHQIILSQAAKIIKIHQSKNLYSSRQVDDADHTFSSIQSRQNLYKVLIQNLTETF